MRTLIGFIAGAIFTLALLTKCSVQNANAGAGDSDNDSGSSVDGGGSRGDGGGAVSDGGGSAAGSDIGKFVYRSGSRIKARVWQTPDGARELKGWWDSELEMSCTMVFINSSHSGNCYPKVWGFLRYLDSACTQPVATCDATDGEVPKFAGGYGDGIWKVGAKLGERALYSKTFEGACIAAAATSYCSVGDEVTKDVFASVSEATVE
jgi:hypothetical protein